ncbi:Aste57867_1802 [Aphanomyces stellatus]|uniref:non-specific serine/threonine protein kinase n=1 Tax=Aphanomyces stellatus TaxID=120398 RepID=A0A485K6K9_9STRA|nr:hypothetical protein As57867_001800 [Aphanomyces stellatus]VFT79011.1 Aste57867_1802 [Aphanomyces stellatus]
MVFHAAIVSGDLSALEVALATSLNQVNATRIVCVPRSLVPEDMHYKFIANQADTIELECTPLLLAIYLGRLEMAELLAACDAVDVNAVNPMKHTPLGVAVAFDMPNIVGALLVRPEIQLNGTNEDGLAPLHVAARTDNIEILRLLLARPGIAVNQTCDPVCFCDGGTALHFAAERGFLDLVNALLAHPDTNPVAMDLANQSPLMRAIVKLNEATALRLLQCPAVLATINDIDKTGKTALILAVYWRLTVIVSSLLAKPHIKLDVRDKTGCTAIMHATASWYHVEILNLFLGCLNDISTLLDAFTEACKSKVFSTATALFDHIMKDMTTNSMVLHDLTVDMLTHFEVLGTLLETTIRQGDVEIMAYVLGHPRFAIEELMPNGEWGRMNVLHIACECGQYKIADLLIGNGMDVNAEASNFTPLELAATKGSLKTVQLILSSPQFNSINHLAPWGKTALIFACGHDTPNIALELLAQPNINIHGNSISTPMQTALFTRLFEVVEVLIAQGASFNVVFESDPLLLHVAPFLHLGTATTLLLRDFPVIVNPDGSLHPHENHSYSWNIFMDSSTPVPKELRLETIQTILDLEQFSKCRDELVRALAFSQDKNGRSVLQTTDAAARKYFYDQIYFCGRYEIHDGPPIHVSSTAVVVHAIDHGIYKQLFNQHANNAVLDQYGYDACVQILGQTDRARTTNEGSLVSDFEMYDKNKNGVLSEVEFMHYCDQVHGGEHSVAMKFMRNCDEYIREIDMRQGWNSQSVVELLPMAPTEEFESQVCHLKLHANLNVAEYPHVLVMPLADRSLEDIYLKERPNDNHIRNMLQEIAVLLQQLHENSIIHGDLKKLNVLRVHSHMRLIDMDGASKAGQYFGLKFSSGNLPPELFHKLKDEKEKEIHLQYWHSIVGSNTELWEKVKPRNNWVVKTFHLSKDPQNILPYEPVIATPALDMWAFGVMMYQLYSGVELIPTDRNQDVDESGIERAATWTKDDLSTRIQNKVSNPLVRDLLMKLLAIEPNDRISAKAMLSHEYFDVNYDPNEAKAFQVINSKLDQISNKVATGFDSMKERLDQVVELNRVTLEALGSAKEDLMRSIFQATEVQIPTSFVLLPFNILDKQDDDEEAVAATLAHTASFFHKGIEMGASFMISVKANKTIGTAIKTFSAGEPLYLYLLDEVQGIPVVPPRSTTGDEALYPIRIETKSDEYVHFMTTAMPFIQTGFKFLKGINTVATLAKSLGIPSLDKETLANIGDNIEKAKKTSSVFDFQVLQAAVEAHDSTVPVHQIRGAALRELERFFSEKDKERNFAGLGRTYSASGQSLWTAKESIEAFENGKRPEKVAVTASTGTEKKKGKTAQEIFAQLFQPPRQPVEEEKDDFAAFLRLLATELADDGLLCLTHTANFDDEEEDQPMWANQAILALDDVVATGLMSPASLNRIAVGIYFRTTAESREACTSVADVLRLDAHRRLEMTYPFPRSHVCRGHLQTLVRNGNERGRTDQS